MVQVVINLLSLSVLSQQTTKHAQPAGPDHLERHTRIHGTLSLTVASVTSKPLSLHQTLVTGLTVHNRRLLRDHLVLDQLADARARGALVLDRSRLGRVKPYLLLAALKQ